MRESKDDKALRYLVEGRIIVTTVSKPIVRATARGDGAIYRITHTAAGWSCNCPARSQCAHIKAVGHVTAP